MTDEPAPRLSPWWMAAPALLFIANFVAAAFTSSSTSKNAVYNASAIVGTVAVDVVLIGYVLFAARASRRPVARTLAIVRTPLRPAIRLCLGALGVIVVSNLVLEPVLHASQRQGIAPTHDPRSTHQWVVLAVAIVGLVLVAPAAEELVFRGLGFATLGRYALPADDRALRHRPRAGGAPDPGRDRRARARVGAAEDRVGTARDGRPHEPERPRPGARAARFLAGGAWR